MNRLELAAEWSLAGAEETLIAERRAEGFADEVAVFVS